ncbi:MAG: effector binding domain-containing protein [Polyangiaceae bacterium]|nr:effector binding domain-containing protein [Polyangiaceae bacterium]
MSYLQRVRRAVDFIESNLDQELDLADVAAHAGISRWHFQRMFKALTKETLKSYIRQRRLALALDKLLTTQERILDISISAGYESQEAFTRAFKQAFDHTPHEFRRIGSKNLFLKKVEIDAGYLRHINQNLSLEPRLIEQAPMRCVGMQTEFFSSDSEKNNIASQIPPLWAAFLPHLEAIPNRVPGVCYGIIEQSAEGSEQLKYTAAMQVTEVSAELPEGMLAVQIPGATYAHFDHRGEVTNLDHSVNYIYSNWLCSSDLRHTYGPDLEVYGAEYHPTSEDSVIQYAIPVVRG